MQWRLLDAVSRIWSLPVLLPAVETCCTTRIALVPAWSPSSEIIRIHVHVPCILAAATIRGWRLFFAQTFQFWSYYSRLATIWGRRPFEGGDHSRVATIRGGDHLRAVTIQGQRPFEGGDYSRAATIRGQWPFEGGDHSRAATIRVRRPFEGGNHSRAVTIWGRWPFEGGNQSRPATIWGRWPFEGGVYLKKYSSNVTTFQWQLEDPNDVLPLLHCKMTHRHQTYTPAWHEWWGWLPSAPACQSFVQNTSRDPVWKEIISTVNNQACYGYQIQLPTKIEVGMYLSSEATW